MTLLCLNARFVLTPHAAAKSVLNSNQVLRSKHEKSPSYEAQTTKAPRDVYPL